MGKIYFVSGIDTDAGKTYVTAAVLKYLHNAGVKATSFKLIQTGSANGRSEDIDAHRKLAKMMESDEDQNGLTFPEVFTYPASPHLAAEIDQRAVDFHKIEQALEEVSKNYDVVLVEGAGGLMVPLTRTLLTIDYVATQKWPLLLVSSGKLGSINHTLLSLEAAKLRNIPIVALLYNSYPANDSIIGKDTKGFLQNFLQLHYPDSQFATSPLYADGEFVEFPNFQNIFN